MYLIYYIASSATVAAVRETSFLFLQNIYFSIFKFFFLFCRNALLFVFSRAFGQILANVASTHVQSYVHMYVCLAEYSRCSRCMQQFARL